MTKFSLIFLLVCLNVALADSTPHQSAPPSPAKGKQYAVLLSHTWGYHNYWSQASLFHAYHSLVKNGVDPDNIIVLTFDDIAGHPDNPYPNQVFNSPTTEGGGYDVYKGVKIDHVHFEPETFLAVLKGDQTRSFKRKVLTSTADDNVFIFSIGHGGKGFIVFEYSEHRRFLYGIDLVDALKFMHRNKRYKRLVYYMEACFSGSMFQTLPQDINVYALTSSDPKYPSAAFYCPPGINNRDSDNEIDVKTRKDIVNGKPIGACLATHYSLNFLTHMDNFNLHGALLEDQLNFIRENTFTSKVMHFGSKAILEDSVANYQSDPKKYNGKNKLNKENWEGHFAHLTHMKKHVHSVHSGFVEENNAKMVYLSAKQKRNPSKKTMSLLMEEIASQKKVDHIFKQIKAKFALNVKVFVQKVDFKCMKARMKFYTETCGSLSEYGLKYSKFIHQTCIQNVKDDAYEFGVKMICNSPKSKKHPSGVINK